MEETEAAFQELKESFEALRSAVEQRDYPALDLLLPRQRDLLRSVPSSDPRTQELALQGSELVQWAITMLKIQRAGYVQSLAGILNGKQVDSNYSGTSSKRADLISVQA